MTACHADAPAPTRPAQTSTLTPARSSAPTPSRTPSPTPRPVDPLTGSRTVSKNPVVAVKIDNTANGRPQVGVGAADQVWVEEVEGGVTRLMAVFHTTLPKQAGPVRSARSTDVELLPVYGRPLLLYSGANHNVEHKLDASTIPHKTPSIPQKTGGSPGFRRIHNRRAPYNLMVDVRSAAKGATNSGPAHTLIAFAAKDARWSAAPKKTSAKVRIGGGTEAFRWTRGHYQVSTNDRAVTDGGQRVLTDNVVIMSVRNVKDGNEDVAGAPSVKSRTIGSGKVTVLRDGRALAGTWKRGKVGVPLQLLDAKGKPLPLHPGRTWFLLQG